MNWLTRLFKRPSKHVHQLRHLFGEKFMFAVYGCDECGRAFCTDKFGVTDVTRDLPTWQHTYPKQLTPGL